MNKFNEITKNVINIYDGIPHSNIKCQNIKEDWTKYCFYNENKENIKHKEFLYYIKEVKSVMNYLTIIINVM